MFLPRASRLWLFLPLLAHLLALRLFLADAYSVTDFPLDDAWIHQVYARSLAAFQGFAYNPGQQEAGFSSLLWPLLTAPAHWLPGPDPFTRVAAVKVIGSVLGLLFILFFTRVAHRITRNRWLAAVAGCLLALDPRLLFAELSGMETILLLALWMGAAAALLNRRHLLFLLCLGLAPAARPEGIILLPVALAGLLGLRRQSASRLKLAAGALLAVLPSLCWVAFCLTTNGHPLPNTFYLKAHPFRFGLLEFNNTWEILTQYGWNGSFLFSLGLLVFFFGCLSRLTRASWTALGLLGAAPLLYAVAVAGSRDVQPVGYYWTRWLDPASLMLTAAWGLGIVLLVPEIKHRLVRWSFPRVSWVLPAGLLLLALPGFTTSFQGQRVKLSSDSRAIRIMNVDMGYWINRNTPENAVVAVNDAGAIRYFGQRRTLDLIGLNLADRAFRRVSTQALAEQADWLAIFPRWFDATGELDAMLMLYEPRFSITIPLKEYTICPTESQTLKTAYRKKTSQDFTTVERGFGDGGTR
jgi:hypothetical protein